MIARVGGYSGTPFKGYWRVNQGEPLSPTISNVVLYVVLQHWITVVASTEEAVDPGTADTEGFDKEVQ